MTSMVMFWIHDTSWHHTPPLPTFFERKENHLRVSINGGTPFIIHFNWIFPYKPSSYWGTPIYGNPHLRPSLTKLGPRSTKPCLSSAASRASSGRLQGSARSHAPQRRRICQTRPSTAPTSEPQAFEGSNMVQKMVRFSLFYMFFQVIQRDGHMILFNHILQGCFQHNWYGVKMGGEKVKLLCVVFYIYIYIILYIYYII